MNNKFTYRLRLFMVFLLGLPAMITGCKQGPSEPEALIQIEEVVVTPELLVGGRTARFEAITGTPEADMEFVWELEQSGGETIQQRTDSTVLFWEVSSASGIHNHTVHIENSEQKIVSEVFPFSVQVERIPDSAQVMDVQVSPQPVLERQTISFNVVLDNRDPGYRYAWQLRDLNGVVRDTVTETDQFRWWAPNQQGTYSHNVTLVSEFGDTLSNTYYFEVMVNDNPEPPARIVFAAKDENSTYQIHSMNPDGTDILQLTDHQGSAFSPSWSPYGDYIVYSSFDQGTTAGPALWIMDYDGSNARVLLQVAAGRGLAGTNARWSPDGTKIAYDWTGEFTPTNIYVFDIRTNEITQLTDHPARDMVPMWSPDGTQLLFSSNREYFQADTLRFRRDLYLINADSEKLERITNSGNGGGYTWKNNKEIVRRIFNSSTNINEFFLVNIDTDEVEKINIDFELNELNWVHTENNQELIYLVSKDGESATINLFVLDLNGSIVESEELENSIFTETNGFNWHIPES